MPKMKSNKALSKKVKVTKNGKVLRRATSQNHYNAKDTGKFKRSKRKDSRLFKADEQNILKALAI